jgi:hypothetical protein
MTSKNKKVMWIAIVAGLLLLIAGVNGVAAWETIKEFVLDNFGNNTVLQFVFAILIFIASLGGISVIAGGILIGKDKVRTGKFLISLGSGLGIIGLLISIYVGFVENSLTISSFFSIGMIGLILSIIARLMAKKK